MNRLQLNEVSASHGARQVLHGVSMSVGRGEIVAVLGPSGCGKTTLLRAVAGLHLIDAGRIVLDGREVAAHGRSMATEKRGVGLMPQEGALFPHLDVARNIGFGLSGPVRARRERVREMAELAGVGDLLSARPQHLSGGQQQRVALARALAPRPGVVLLDEPFASLDAGLRTSLRSEVVSTLRAQDAAAVLVTHDQVEALSMADRVAVMLDGVIEQMGSPREIYERPGSRRVAEFVGEADFIPASRNGNTASTPIGVIEVTGGGTGRGVVVLRPEHLSLSAEPDGEFVVVGATYTGPDAVVFARHRTSGSGVHARITSAAPGTGEMVRVTVTRPLAFLED